MHSSTEPTEAPAVLHQHAQVAARGVRRGGQRKQLQGHAIAINDVFIKGVHQQRGGCCHSCAAACSHLLLAHTLDEEVMGRHGELG